VGVDVRGDSVATVQGIEAPVTSLPARDRGPRAVRLSIGRDVDGQGVSFVNVPAYGVVQVIRPDGTVLRTLSDGGQQSVNWDFRSDAGRLVGGGLYRVRVLGRDRSGRALPAQTLAFGIVRRHA
jgi:hypothetical protein